MPAIDNETAFAELVRDYENQWIAIDDKDGVKFIVGSGKDAVEAAQAAEEKGFPDAALLRVPSFSSTFLPSTPLTAPFCPLQGSSLCRSAMYIERNAISSSTPFGGAELNETLTAQAHSAPPNGVGGSWILIYKHLTPNGVKAGSPSNKRSTPLLFSRQTAM